jgi:hypothetical protein
MLIALDKDLEQLRNEYRRRTGRELEILILSDHGNNRGGAGKRVAIRGFLKKAGYRVGRSIRDQRDVVLPTAGIEAWVEMHNAPGETARLLPLLSRLEGVEILTAPDPEVANRFTVMNWRGERARIDFDPDRNAYLYEALEGDPLNYLPTLLNLRRQHLLDEAGFGSAQVWMNATIEHYYPVALERIVRGHTRLTFNPATILVSLKRGYVHANWFIKLASGLKRCGGTHGGLSDLDSNGIVLSHFAATQDTSGSRVASLFQGFPGLVRNQTEFPSQTAGVPPTK